MNPSTWIWIGLALGLATPPARASGCDPKMQCCAKDRKGREHAVSEPLVHLLIRAAQKLDLVTPAQRPRVAARALARALAESGGNPTAVADMDRHTAGRPFDWSSPDAGGQRWKRETVLLNLSRRYPVTHNEQTNYGIFQQSVDTQTNDKSGQNQNLVSYYQNLIRKQPERAWQECDSQNFYQPKKSAKAFFGDAATCPARLMPRCFGRLVMLCPALNAELGLRALVTNPAYYERKKLTPACERYLRSHPDLAEKPSPQGSATASKNPGAAQKAD